MRKSVLLWLAAALTLTVQARTPNDSLPSADGHTPTDSLATPSRRSFAARFDRLSSSRLYRATSLGLPLVVGGLLVKSEDDHFRSLRNDYLPHFDHHADDYLQYAPAAVMLALKAAGVKGRSTWGRMLASDAASALLMAGVVNTLKQTTRVTRPDGSNNHSFPSGHTATAFMTATMLTKEYGHKSPWVSIGAYSVATATGLMRMANNKHWLSDVLTGAGIGILTTELGYALTDLIFREKGLETTLSADTTAFSPRPSFVSLYLGVNIPLSGYDIDEAHKFRTSSGSTTGLEGAWLFNRYVGVGGRFTVSNTAIVVDGNQAEDNTFDALTLSAGAYFSCPLSPHWLVGSKVLGGWVRYPRLDLSAQRIPARQGFCAGSGLSLTYRATPHYGLRFFMDYNLMPSHSRGSREWMNTLTCGAALSVMF